MCWHWHCNWSLLLFLTVCRWEVSYWVTWGDTDFLHLLSLSFHKENVCEGTDTWCQFKKVGWQREQSSPVGEQMMLTCLSGRGRTPCSGRAGWSGPCPHPISGKGSPSVGWEWSCLSMFVEVPEVGLCSCCWIGLKRQQFRLPDTCSTRSYRKTATWCIQLPQTSN